ncbi:MAG: POTRA domain-containing protein [Crocinitomicaceae bacterium]
MPSKLLLFCILFQSLAFSALNDSTVYFTLDKKTIKLQITQLKSIEYQKKVAISNFNLDGYIGISISDSILKKGNWHFNLLAEKYFKKVLLKHNSELSFTNLIESPKAINSVLNELENNGFPFSRIVFISQSEKSNFLELNYKIDSGNYLTIRNIIIKSPDDFHQNTIQNLIHIKSGEPYNESKIKDIRELLKNSNLYELIRPPEVLFLKDNADIYLTIKKRRSSIADGFIGFQQNIENQRIELNGNINFTLKNGLNRAELFDLKWQSNPNKSQNLDLEIEYPFLVNLPIGVGGKMTIQKQDTTFIRNSFFGNIKYLASFYSIGVFAQSENSFLLGNNVIVSDNFTNFKRNTFGVNGSIHPRSNGIYQPILNFKIGAFSLATDSIQTQTSSSNFITDFQLIQNIKLFNAFSFKNAIRFQDVQSNQLLSDNQLFYFGGLKSIRGFYELELNGNHVLSINNAIIYRPVKLLSFELIYDYSQFHNSAFRQTHSGGIGFNIENESNTLSLILANGTISGNNFQLQNTKLHLGFISRF